MDKPHFLALFPGEFAQMFRERFSEPAYRAGQIMDQVYALRAADWNEITSAPGSLRRRLAEEFSLCLPTVNVKRVSRDGTIKYLLALEDGVRVESVLIPDKDRRTVCFSTQAGCALGCAFCATGRGGFRRNLNVAEITGQVMAIEREAGVRVTNCVAMGQGEPLLNLEATARALRVLNDSRCFGISSRRLTLSTVGIVPAIRRLADLDLPARLAVSLHAARQEVRERLMPVARKHPLPELKAALREYVDRTKNRVTFEYILLKGINDSPGDARAVADFARGLPVFVNVIPWNPVPGAPYRAPDHRTVRSFVALLEASGLETALRREKGGDIEAACGQLTQQCHPE